MTEEETLKVAARKGAEATLTQELADMALGMAIRLHTEVNQTYDGQPYAQSHCVGVADILAEFGFTAPFWRTVALLHDVPEDCLRDMTPEERRQYLVRHYGEIVAHTVWCVSGFGATRKIRNAVMKEKIIADWTGLSPILKCADRLYHGRHSERGSGYWCMYRDEMADFERYIRPHVPEEMWNALTDCFKAEEKN